MLKKKKKMSINSCGPGKKGILCRQSFIKNRQSVYMFVLRHILFRLRMWFETSFLFLLTFSLFWLTITLRFHFVKWVLELYGSTLIISRYTIVAEHNGFTLVVRASVRPSVFSFPDDNLSNFNGFSSHLKLV